MMKGKLYVASEYTDPCFHENEAIERLGRSIRSPSYAPCLLLITKNIGKCQKIIDFCNTNKIPFILHSTVTGLGGTKIEPNVLPYNTVLNDLSNLIKNKILDSSRVVIRIDPIVPFYSKIEVIADILDKAKNIGITQCRISIVDYYRHVIDRMHLAELKHGSKFQIGYSDKDQIIGKVFAETVKRGIHLFLCAEVVPPDIAFNHDLNKWISNRGCASMYEWAKLGYELETFETRQRMSCTCDAKKQELLGIEKGCLHSCIYCYWRRIGDRVSVE